MAEVNLSEILDFAIELAKQAGKTIADGQARRFAEGTTFDTKLNSADLLTETDQATEQQIKDAISKKYPGHAFIGEESAKGTEQLTDQPTWIVDPIDGTTNFIHGFPFCCTSIGFAVNREPAVGVIFSPFLNHLYYGSKGQGAYLVSGQDSTPRKLPLAKPLPLPSLRQALVAMEWGSGRHSDVLESKLRSFRRLTGDPADVSGGKMCQGVRSIGSAALVSANVAAGAIDVYYEIGVWSWDVCAGIVLIREAGGVTVGSQVWTEQALQSGQIGQVPPEVLMGRKYLSIRAIADTSEQTGAQAQEQIIKEFFDAVEEFDPK